MQDELLNHAQMNLCTPDRYALRERYRSVFGVVSDVPHAGCGLDG